MKSTEDNRADRSCTHLGADINILSYLLPINAREEGVYDVLSILSSQAPCPFPSKQPGSTVLTMCSQKHANTDTRNTPAHR